MQLSSYKVFCCVLLKGVSSILPEVVTGDDISRCHQAAFCLFPKVYTSFFSLSDCYSKCGHCRIHFRNKMVPCLYCALDTAAGRVLRVPVVCVDSVRPAGPPWAAWCVCDAQSPGPGWLFLSGGSDTLLLSSAGVC